MPLETCPKCGIVGLMDEDQAAGDVSLVCPSCDHHYYKKKEAA